MRCSSCEPLLDAYLEATLRPRDVRAVGTHVRSCAACSTLLEELRVIDALLATARLPGVAPDFTAAVVSATHATRTRTPRRMPVGVALLLYLGVAWALAAIVALRTPEAGQILGAASAFARSNVAAFGAAARVIAPAAPLAAAAVTGILLLDLLLVVALFYGYRRFRPVIALYLVRGGRT